MNRDEIVDDDETTWDLADDWQGDQDEPGEPDPAYLEYFKQLQEWLDATDAAPGD